tara:strand:+ start:41 stop:193 length:153 start_codon:yes stop_codon:yes gene_type:complete
VTVNALQPSPQVAVVDPAAATAAEALRQKASHIKKPAFKRAFLCQNELAD